MTKPAVLLTGAGRRIGRAIAVGLAAEGHPVAVHYRNSEIDAKTLVEEIEAAGGKAATVKADLTQKAQVKNLIHNAAEALRAPIGILINNAGAFIEDTLATVSEESFQANMATNLEAPLLLSQAFAGALPPGERGNIINLIDQRVLKTTTGFLSYTVSKHALYDLTRILAVELAPDIRVNAIGPGPTFKNHQQSDADFEAEAKSVPLGKGPDVEELVGAVKFILNTPSLTGQMIALDGGQHLI